MRKRKNRVGNGYGLPVLTLFCNKSFSVPYSIFIHCGNQSYLKTAAAQRFISFPTIFFYLLQDKDACDHTSTPEQTNLLHEYNFSTLPDTFVLSTFFSFSFFFCLEVGRLSTNCGSGLRIQSKNI